MGFIRKFLGRKPCKYLLNRISGFNSEALDQGGQRTETQVLKMLYNEFESGKQTMIAPLQCWRRSLTQKMRVLVDTYFPFEAIKTLEIAY